MMLNKALAYACVGYVQENGYNKLQDIKQMNMVNFKLQMDSFAQYFALLNKKLCITLISITYTHVGLK